MPKDKKKKQKNKKANPRKIKIQIPVFICWKIKWNDLTIFLDKKGRISKTREDFHTGETRWTHFNKDGKVKRTSTFGKGWEEETRFTYDGKGRRTGSVTTHKKGIKTTITRRKYDPKTGKVTDTKRKVYLDGLH